MEWNDIFCWASVCHSGKSQGSGKNDRSMLRKHQNNRQ